VNAYRTINQTGPGTFSANLPVTIQPLRPDGSFIGTATFGDARGAGFGSLRDGVFQFTITWTNFQIGVYSGIFDQQGFLIGSTFDATNPSNVAAWKSSRSFT
jgi:hypothetical protein